ncbi:MAG: PIN domain-containing protein [Planctomycetota bacterium]|nr:PIN domain-containing protein [Planctomycetota bacterium]
MFLDTSVLVYAVDPSRPAHRARARACINGSSGNPFVISTQVLQEFYVSLTRSRQPRFDQVGAERAVRLFIDENVHTVGVSTILKTMESNRKWCQPLWDDLIVQSALESGRTRLLTEDMQHGRRYGQLVIENPFLDI